MKALYTSYYGKAAKHPLAVAITSKPPHWFNGRACKALAPPWSLVDSYKKGEITAEQYTSAYLGLLQSKNAQEIVDGLPDGAVLLCYEKPGEFCHRHLAAEWLMENAQVTITELK